LQSVATRELGSELQLLNHWDMPNHLIRGNPYNVT
jgi:hypothetical protein